MKMISFIGDDAEKCLLPFFAFSPSEAIFIYSHKIISEMTLRTIMKAAELKEGRTKCRFTDVAFLDKETLIRFLDKLVEDTKDVFFELSASSAPTTVYISRYCEERSLCAVCYDRENRRPCPLTSAPIPEYTVPELTVNDILTIHGASSIRSGRNAPEEKYFPIFKELIGVILKDIKAWRRHGKFLQRAQAAYSDGSSVKCRTELHMKTETLVMDEDLMRALDKAGAIELISLANGYVHFRFTDGYIKDCLCDIGIWTEVITYLTALKTGRFDDVRMSVKIDWDGEIEDKVFGYAYNEIDCVLVNDSIPTFISCKTSEPSIEAVNELYVYGKKFGGPHARLGIVTLCDIETSNIINTSIAKRCHELDITLIDISDILSGNMEKKLLEM